MFSHATMLSLKLSQQIFPKTINSEEGITSLEPVGVVMTLHTDSQSWEPHRELIEILGIRNNFISYKHVYLFFLIFFILFDNFVKISLLFNSNFLFITFIL